MQYRDRSKKKNHNNVYASFSNACLFVFKQPLPPHPSSSCLPAKVPGTVPIPHLPLTPQLAPLCFCFFPSAETALTQEVRPAWLLWRVWSCGPTLPSRNTSAVPSLRCPLSPPPAASSLSLGISVSSPDLLRELLRLQPKSSSSLSSSDSSTSCLQSLSRCPRLLNLYPHVALTPVPNTATHHHLVTTRINVDVSNSSCQAELLSFSSSLAVL